ncbi:hypothetical protein SDC9_199860 [bioreactor metagenome]|uniref:Uncharacterized protein n=1 Tax=bioreactor metagenome TaxID=1076179 RepID=A0A645IUY0_9ZZZZ
MSGRADVEQAGFKGKRHGKAGHDQRRRLIKHLGELIGRPEPGGNQRLEAGDRKRRIEAAEQNEAEQQSETDRSDTGQQADKAVAVENSFQFHACSASLSRVWRFAPAMYKPIS